MPCSFAAFLERLVALRQETGKEADASRSQQAGVHGTTVSGLAPSQAHAAVGGTGGAEHIGSE
jgi:hypothetical protein